MEVAVGRGKPLERGCVSGRGSDGMDINIS